jgi:hypothetical protein
VENSEYIEKNVKYQIFTCFEIGSPYAAQAGLEFVILLP